MLAQPRFGSRLFAVGQQGHHAPAFQIADDAAVAMVTAISPIIVCGRPPMASTFLTFERLGRCDHMSGLLMRSKCPLALMKSDDQDSHQCLELFGSDDWSGFSGSSVQPLSFITSISTHQTRT